MTIFIVFQLKIEGYYEQASKKMKIDDFIKIDIALATGFIFSRTCDIFINLNFRLTN